VTEPRSCGPCYARVKMREARLRQRAFWVLSRTFIGLYRKFPVFGRLRGSAAVVQKGNKFLVIERSDGLGLAFPGGMARPWESDEDVLRREVHEETGLRLTSTSLVTRYVTDKPYPTRVSVFRAEAEGELQSSWEGVPQWVELTELQQRLTAALRPVLESGVLES
jgi:8-oxo-dGTP pyrophosphatase MutT (NUDIX family)